MQGYRSTLDGIDCCSLSQPAALAWGTPCAAQQGGHSARISQCAAAGRAHNLACHGPCRSPMFDSSADGGRPPARTTAHPFCWLAPRTSGDVIAYPRGQLQLARRKFSAAESLRSVICRNPRHLSSQIAKIYRIFRYGHWGGAFLRCTYSPRGRPICEHPSSAPLARARE
jgi:hypothetical protein